MYYLNFFNQSGDAQSFILLADFNLNGGGGGGAGGPSPNGSTLSPHELYSRCCASAKTRSYTAHHSQYCNILWGRTLASLVPSSHPKNQGANATYCSNRLGDITFE